MLRIVSSLLYIRINKEKTWEKKQKTTSVKNCSFVDSFAEKEFVYFSEVTRWFPNEALL